MALHIIDQPSLGGRLGAAVGTGISGLLENLVEQKVKDIKQKNDAKGYEQGWNLNPQQAQFVASQSPEWQQNFVKALQANQQSDQFNRSINGDQQQQPSVQGFQGGMQQPMAQQPSLEEAMSSMGGRDNPQDAIAMTLQKALPQLLRQGQMGEPAQPPAMNQQQMAPQQMFQTQQPQQTTQPNNHRSVANIMQNQPLNPMLQAKAEEINLKKEQHREKLEAAKNERIDKRENSLKKELEDISKRSERAEQDIRSLNQIKIANDSGALVQGKKRLLLEDLGKKYGLNLKDFFTNPTTEFTAKTIERMQTGAGTAFGTGRLTNFIAEAYGKSLPRLVNTREGMDLIVKNLTLEDRGHIALNDEIRKIKNEYRKLGEPLPFDIQDQARERIQPKLDQYAEESIKNIETAIARQEKVASGNIKSVSSRGSAKDLPNGTIGTRRKTGEKFIVENGEWAPYKG